MRADICQWGVFIYEKLDRKPGGEIQVDMLLNMFDLIIYKCTLSLLKLHIGGSNEYLFD